MTRVEAWFRRWVVFWDGREAPYSLALVRVLVAAAVLGDLLVAWQLDLVPDLWAAPPWGMGFGALGRGAPWTARWLGSGPDMAEIVWLWAVVSAVALLTGTLTRVAALSFSLASAQLAMLSPSADRGIDDLLRIVCAVLAFSGAGACWSVDALIRRWRGKPAVTRIPAWPRYVLFLQLIWVYFSAAQHRGDEDWWPSGGLSALGKILSDPHFARLPPGIAGYVYPLTQLGTLGTMVFELSAPLMLLWTWYERTPRWPGTLRRAAVLLRVRWIWIGVGVAFHLGIAVTMRLGVFPFGMLAIYPVLLHPDELARGFAFVRARLQPLLGRP